VGALRRRQVKFILSAVKSRRALTGVLILDRTDDVKYYYHSGFSVASGETLLVFDYWMGRQGKKLPAAQRITPETLSHFSEVFVFISHGHEDHFDPVVYTWEQYAR